VEAAAESFFFLSTITAGCRHKQSKQCPKGADAKAISFSTLPVIVTRSQVKPDMVTMEHL